MTHTDEISCFVSNQYNVILPLNFLLSYLRRLRAGDTFVTRLGKMNIYLYLRDEVFVMQSSVLYLATLFSLTVSQNLCHLIYAFAFPYPYFLSHNVK